MRTFLQVDNLSRAYGDKVLFENISFTIAEGQKVALIARNGTGKTSILNTIAGWATPGSRLGFDVVNAATLTNTYTRPWIEMQAQAGAPWLGTMEDPAGFLAERGWVASLTQAGQAEASYGRWRLPVLPIMMPGVPHNWFVTAFKQA